ncbi:MAG TPA: helix-turn-helix transcriptional regulator [Micromonosporaceae bacterium]|nr:helix-turn-helix transcriptional regulator [Micromonosporaceae bacterium]
MAQKPRPLQPHLSAAHLLGARLRDHRVRHGLSQNGLGRLIHVSGDLVGKVEKGERRPQESFVTACEAVLGVDGELGRLWAAIGGPTGQVRASLTGNHEIVLAQLPALRRALDAYDLPGDVPAPSATALRQTADRIMTMRLGSQYAALSVELPQVLADVGRAFHSSQGLARQELAGQFCQVFRAADAVADKFAHYDLSARIIGLMAWAAQESGDPAMVATAAYVRAETFFATGDWETGRCMLERAANLVNPAESVPNAAAYGALHMRAAILAARNRRLTAAQAHIDEAATVAGQVPEGVYHGTAFGPASVRIHRVSLSVDAGEPGAALRAAADWVPPLSVPAERRSHFFVDLAEGQAQSGRPGEAVASLQVARRIAPQHVRYHPQVKVLVSALLSRSPKCSASLRQFAVWTGMV